MFTIYNKHIVCSFLSTFASILIKSSGKLVLELDDPAMIVGLREFCCLHFFCERNE